VFMIYLTYSHAIYVSCFFFSSRRRHTRSKRDWSSDVCSSDLPTTTITKLQPIQKPFVWIGSIFAVLLLAMIFITSGAIQGVLYLIGIGLGITLLHARFGFTSAFRRLVAVGNAQGIQAHMIMLAVATTLFALILSTGFSFTGEVPTASVAPVGISIITGSFLFGIGMQMGNGCASGTL